MRKKILLSANGFVLLWNSGFIGAEYGLPYTGPFTLVFWRYLALTILIGLYLMVRRRFWKISRSAIGASLFYLGHPVTMLMAWIAFGDALTITDITGLAIVFVGILLTHVKSKKLLIPGSEGAIHQ